MHENNMSGRKPENECIITGTVEGMHKNNMAKGTRQVMRSNKMGNRKCNICVRKSEGEGTVTVWAVKGMYEKNNMGGGEISQEQNARSEIRRR